MTRLPRWGSHHQLADRRAEERLASYFHKDKVSLRKLPEFQGTEVRHSTNEEGRWLSSGWCSDTRPRQSVSGMCGFRGSEPTSVQEVRT